MKFILLLLLFLSKSWSDSFFIKDFQSSIKIFDDLYNEQKLNKFGLVKSIDSIKSKILNDPQNLIKKEFKDESRFLRSKIDFWFNIYSSYNTNNIVIHDKNNLKIIYKILDFEFIEKDQNLSIFQKAYLKNSITQEETSKIKNELYGLIKKYKPKNALFQILKENGVKLSKYKNKRKKIIYKLIEGLRTQTGQSDQVDKAYLRFLPFRESIEHIFKRKGVPTDLIAISFVESSFNPMAVSSSGASGVWQFMPNTAASFFPKNSHKDYRNNELVATWAAASLLKQNKMVTRSWTLSIPAYNFGTSHIVKARRKMNKRIPKLRDLFRYFDRSNNRSIGFASENYFAEFLAMDFSLKYFDFRRSYKKIKSESMQLYYVLCEINLKDSSFEKIIKLNHLSKNKTRKIKNEFIMYSSELDEHLKKKLYKISDVDFKKHTPKTFYKEAKKFKCKN